MFSPKDDRMPSFFQKRNGRMHHQVTRSTSCHNRSELRFSKSGNTKSLGAIENEHRQMEMRAKPGRGAIPNDTAAHVHQSSRINKG
jgi:hypothetical protein